MTQNHGKIWWSELMTRDVPAAREYYEAVCGWTIEEMQMPEGPYFICKQGEEMVAGIMDMTPMTHLDGVPSHWFTYIAVDDIDAAMTATVAAGGVVQRAPFEVGEVGKIAIVTDSTGAAVGLMQPSEQG